MKVVQKKYAWLVILVLFTFLFLQGKGMAQNATVVLKCGDIGVEARRILADLKAERNRFENRKQLLDRREDELKILQEEVDKKLKQMTTLREELTTLLAQKAQRENERLKKLSKIYQKREPAGAAASLAAMKKDMAVSILSLMRDKYAGEILDNMEREKAVEYSTSLGRLSNE